MMHKITELLSAHGVAYKRYGEHHHTTRNRIQIDCPHCSPDSGRFRMGLNRYSAVCWSCGGHNLAATLKLIISDHDAVNEFMRSSRTTLNEEMYEAVHPVTQGKLELPDGITRKFLPQHEQYLLERDFSLNKIQALWDIKSIGRKSILPWRIFIPIKLRHKIVSWTTRSIGSVRARYISARPDQEIHHHKHLLYGEDYADKTVIVVEGPLDVWRIGPGAVATFGTSYTRQQVLRIVQYPVRYICYDCEPVATRQAEQLVSELSVFPGKTAKIVLPDSDPADSSQKVISNLRKLLD